MSKHFKEFPKVAKPVEEVAPDTETTIDTKEPVFGKVACAHLNVRKDPNGTIIGVIPEGTKVTIEDELTHKDWYEITTIGTGLNGFCMKKFITKD